MIAANPDISLVLMDIHDAGDGWIQTHPAYPRAWRVPAVADRCPPPRKEMKGDFVEKCSRPAPPTISAKPVNTEQLLTMLRMWLHR